MKISELSPEEQEKVRQYNREQKRDKRRQERLKRDVALLAEGNRRQAERMNEQGRQERALMGLCFFGENRPGHDTDTVESALQVCREFARLLGQEDIQDGESLKQFEIRIGQAWLQQGGPFLNRAKQKLFPGWGDYWREKDFMETYKFLPGAAQKIDIERLSPLPEIAQGQKPPASVEVSPVQPSDEQIERKVLERGRVQLVQQVYCVPADALRYLNGDGR